MYRFLECLQHLHHAQDKQKFNCFEYNNNPQLLDVFNTFSALSPLTILSGKGLQRRGLRHTTFNSYYGMQYLFDPQRRRFFGQSMGSIPIQLRDEFGQLMICSVIKVLNANIGLGLDMLTIRHPSTGWIIVHLYLRT